jgi:hypothetical protein
MDRCDGDLQVHTDSYVLLCVVSCSNKMFSSTEITDNRLVMPTCYNIIMPIGRMTLFLCVLPERTPSLLPSSHIGAHNGIRINMSAKFRYLNQVDIMWEDCGRQRKKAGDVFPGRKFYLMSQVGSCRRCNKCSSKSENWT